MEFYVLEEEMDSPGDTEALPVDPVYGAEAPRCGECGRFVAGLPWLPPFKVEVSAYAEVFGDYVWGPGVDPLFSSRFVQWFRDHDLRGLVGDPIEVGVAIARYPRIEATAPSYFVWEVARRDVHVDASRSHIVRSDEASVSCSSCGGDIDLIDGFQLDGSTWSGEDIFVTPHVMGTVIVTDRFVDGLNGSGLTNMVTIPTEEYRWNPEDLSELL